MRTGGLERWMYRGGSPNGLAKVLNRAWAAVFAAGLRPGWVVTLEVPGRRTGRLVSVPLVVADLDGERYLVSMLGERANWVRNVRAAGGRVTLRHGDREVVRLEEVRAPGKGRILRRYLDRAPAARAHVPIDRRHASAEEYDRVAEHLPVFRAVADE